MDITVPLSGHANTCRWVRTGPERAAQRLLSYAWQGCAGGLLLLCAMATPAAPEFPAFTGPVVDEAGVISPKAKAELQDQLARYQKTTGRQVVVATVKSLGGYSIEEFGYQLGRHWGVGQEGKNDGVLFIVVPVERVARIEVGYGLEGTLTDALSSDIIQRSVLPTLAAGEPDVAIRSGVNNIIGVLDGVYAPGVAPGSGATSSADGSSSDDEAAYIGLLIFGIVLILVGEMIHHFMPERRRSGKVFGGLVGIMAALLFVAFAGGVGVVVGAIVGWLAYRFHLLLGKFEQKYDVTWDPDPEIRKQKRRELQEQSARGAPWLRLLGLLGGRGGGPRGGGGSFGGGGASGKW